MSIEDMQMREMALMLSRRGQTIYGRERIVELCTKSGVSLLDDFAEDDIYQDSTESLCDFISRYSKISAASKFTVLVLARLLDVTLPEELTKKKMTLTDFLGSLPDFFSELSRELRG